MYRRYCYLRGDYIHYVKKKKIHRGHENNVLRRKLYPGGLFTKSTLCQNCGRDDAN